MSGPQCCQNPPSLSSSSSSGNGHEAEFGGLNCYISGSVDSKLGVLLISDIFGFEAPNLRKIADKVAAAGFFVVVPDFFFGDFFVGDPLGPGAPLQTWLKRHGPDQGFEHAKPVIEAFHSNGITNVGAAGYCWGAKVVTELTKYAYIQAAVLLHPAFVSLDDIQAVKVPISILGAEIDQMCPPELVKKFEEALNPGVDSFVKIFAGVSHGWAVRYKDDDEREVKSANEAFQDMLDWFVKYLK